MNINKFHNIHLTSKLILNKDNMFGVGYKCIVSENTADISTSHLFFRHVSLFTMNLSYIDPAEVGELIISIMFWQRMRYNTTKLFCDKLEKITND